MKTSTWFLAALVVCAGVAAAAAATDLEAFQKHVGKVAPPVDARPKAPCYCVTDLPTYKNRVGFLRQTVSSNQVFVTCTGAIFDAAGNDIGTFFCPDFMPMVK